MFSVGRAEGWGGGYQTVDLLLSLHDQRQKAGGRWEVGEVLGRVDNCILLSACLVSILRRDFEDTMRYMGCVSASFLNPVVLGCSERGLVMPWHPISNLITSHIHQCQMIMGKSCLKNS